MRNTGFPCMQHDFGLMSLFCIDIILSNCWKASELIGYSHNYVRSPLIDYPVKVYLQAIQESTMASQFIEDLRSNIRMLGYSLATEKTYLLWSRRFIHFTGNEHPSTVPLF